MCLFLADISAERTVIQLSEKTKRIFDRCTTVLVVLVVLLAIAFVGVRLIGLDVYAVLSGSMQPKYPVGALLYVRDCDPAELQPGDVITYLVAEETVVTHRIVEVLPDEKDPGVLRFRTKGDANDVEDMAPVHQNNIIGTPVFHIPYLGYVSNYIQKPPGRNVAIIGCATLILLTFLPDFFGKKRTKEELPAEGEANTESSEFISHDDK